MTKCEKCGSYDVQVVMWVHQATGQVGEDYGNWNSPNMTWCGECEEHTPLVIDAHGDPTELLASLQGVAEGLLSSGLDLAQGDGALILAKLNRAIELAGGPPVVIEKLL